MQLDLALQKNRIGARKRTESFLSIIKQSRKHKIMITNHETANSPGILRKNQVVAVLSIGKENRLRGASIDTLSAKNAYQCVQASDLGNFDTVLKFNKHVFPQTRFFFNYWLPKGNVLVHCRRGVCRSPLVVLDYLINVEKKSIDEVASLLMSQRSCAKPTTTLLQSIFL